jgi:alkylmercury lyase-like protein
MAIRFPEHLHYLLTKYVIETGHAPDLASLSALAGRSENDTEDGLRQLEKMHGVILVPNSVNVWSLHPFSLMPTAFWVTNNKHGWWANCAWCSLGIGAALGENVTITTSDGAEATEITFRVKDGQLSRSDLMLHFPYPPARWWDNPYCPCGNILFFSSEPKVDDWCERHRYPKGAILDIEKSVKLANLWFGDYASPEWRRKSPAQAKAIFDELRLDSSFWNTEAFR